MKIILTAFLLLVSLSLVAQKDIVITGVVKDSLDVPLPGTVVSIKDTEIGTICNIDGEYSITIPANKIDKNMVLVYFIVGFKPKELKLNLSILKTTKKL